LLLYKAKNKAREKEKQQRQEQKLYSLEKKIPSSSVFRRFKRSSSGDG